MHEIKIGSQIFTINNTPTQDEMALFQAAVEDHKRAATGGEYDQPGVEIRVVLKDAAGKVWGGVIASTVLRVMHLEVLWVAEELRRRGYGGRLVLAAERIGYQKGCRSAQTWTFSFQGPEFYPTIGYQPIGTYDGYPDGITEHAFIKPLEIDSGDCPALEVPDPQGFTLTTDVSEEDAKILHTGLHQHVVAHVGDGYKGIRIQLVVKDREGKLIGGLEAWTTLRNLIFEYLWVEEGQRGLGLGRCLMEAMESIARENGCIASQAYCFSFQALGFFQKMGYHILGVSQGYPPPVAEYYLIKKYTLIGSAATPFERIGAGIRK